MFGLAESFCDQHPVIVSIVNNLHLFIASNLWKFNTPSNSAAEKSADVWAMMFYYRLGLVDVTRDQFVSLHNYLTLIRENMAVHFGQVFPFL